MTPVTLAAAWGPAPRRVVDEMPLTMQCELAGVPRSTVYRRLEAVTRQACMNEEDDLLGALIDEEHTDRPFYGSRRMAVFLRGRGHRVNRKRVQRLMREMGLTGMAPSAWRSPCRRSRPLHWSIGNYGRGAGKRTCAWLRTTTSSRAPAGAAASHACRAARSSSTVPSAPPTMTSRAR